MPESSTPFANPGLSVPDLVWKRCDKLGDQVALVDINNEKRSFTFKEFCRKSKNVAAFLIEKGIRHGDVIGLSAPNSSQYTIAMVGIMACGATVAPLNPDYKGGEILQMFGISKPKAVIVHENGVEIMESVKDQLSDLEEIFVIGKSDKFTTLESMSKAIVDLESVGTVRINPSEDVAILPCSSGTTGSPKCVMLTHKNLIAMTVSFDEQTKWSQGNSPVLYINRPMYNIIGILEVISTLALGMKGIVEQNFGLHRMLKAIETHKVTNLVTVPPIMLDLANEEDIKKYDTSSLELISCGGAPIAPNILRRLAEEFKLPMAQDYGLTECNIIAFGYVKDYPSAIGFVFPSIEIKIVDLRTREKCLANQTGEILAKGPQVMKGYLNNPKATLETIDEEGWLHTGDIGKLDENSRMYITGRIKEVIKYKGLQVPPAELEGVLLNHPKVADVGVVGVPDSFTGELPMAFIVKKCGSVTEHEIDSFVKGQLADYKQLRGGIVFVDTIPKSINGKIERNQLKEMALTRLN